MKKFMILLYLLPAILLLNGCLPQKEKKQPKVHTLKMSSYPAQAVAHILGKTFDLPHEFRMTPGTYLFRIEKPGYAPEWFSCRVRETGIEIPQTAANGSLQWKKMASNSKQITLQKQGGTVLLTSNPNTVRVVKDGQELGVTPLVLTDLPVGKHSALLKSPNYADVTVNWEIRNNSPIIVQTNLQSNIGQLVINSTPDKARVFIAGKFVGLTPYRGTCTVGTHAVRLQRDGHLPYETHVTLLNDKLTKKEVTLAVSPCTLNIVSVPGGAQVFLNNQPRGTTPLTLKDLPAGQYQIAVAHDGYDQQEETVELAPGCELRKEFTLASSQGGIELNVYPAGVKVFLNGREIGTVQQGETKTQTRLLRIDKLAPGTYYVKAIHKRANPETRKIQVLKGQIARPPRIDVWVPNAEIVWKENGKTEVGMIYGESDKVILFGPQKGIRYEIDKVHLNSIKFLDINE